MQKKEIIRICLFLIIFIPTVSVAIYYSYNPSRAVLVSPRLGAALIGPETPGPGRNTTIMLNTSITIWVAPDRAENSIPSEWKNKDLWSVALIPSIMPTADCRLLIIEQIITGSNPQVLFGTDMERTTNPSAIGIVCKIPADIEPLLFNLAVGFKEPITLTRQRKNELELVPSLGSWLGPINSASSFLTQSPKFLLLETNCIYFPWLYDPKPYENWNITSSIGVNVTPFTLMQVSDLHYDYEGGPQAIEDQKWEQDAKVMAPNIMVLTGDITDAPDINQYVFAYNRLKSLNLPLIVIPGNHDYRTIQPWRNTFGPYFTSTTFQSIKIVTYDSCNPLSSSFINWLEQETKKDAISGPVFLACHHPPEPSYTGWGWISILDIMKTNNVDAFLSGHTHTDMLGDIAKIASALVKNPSEKGIEKGLELTNNTMGYLRPINTPQLIITRSSSKLSDVIGQKEYFPNVSKYSGYRTMTIVNNQVWNYTYDYDGDGIREPQLSVPNGRFLVNINMDADLGTSLTAGLNWTVSSNLTSWIPAGRALICIPKPPTGKQWNLLSLTSGISPYIRSVVSNGTHYVYDIRVTIPSKSNVTIRLEPI